MFPLTAHFPFIFPKELCYQIWTIFSILKKSGQCFAEFECSLSDQRKGKLGRSNQAENPNSQLGCEMRVLFFKLISTNFFFPSFNL